MGTHDGIGLPTERVALRGHLPVIRTLLLSRVENLVLTGSLPSLQALDLKDCKQVCLHGADLSSLARLKVGKRREAVEIANCRLSCLSQLTFTEGLLPVD